MQMATIQKEFMISAKFMCIITEEGVSLLLKSIFQSYFAVLKLARNRQYTRARRVGDVEVRGNIIDLEVISELSVSLE